MFLALTLTSGVAFGHNKGGTLKKTSQPVLWSRTAARSTNRRNRLMDDIQSGHLRPRLFLVILTTLALFMTIMATPATADAEPRCRLSGSAIITTGDTASGSAHTTDFVANLGTGRWRHITPSGDRFDGRIAILSCHSNTGDIADVEGIGSFRGSTVVLTFLLHIEDRASLGEPDYYAAGFFSGMTSVYSTAGSVVAGDFAVTITP
jgi:hypothetical protein